MEATSERVQGGRLAAQAVKAEGVDAIFTLCGGHVMPVYEGCAERAWWDAHRCEVESEPALSGHLPPFRSRW